VKAVVINSFGDERVLQYDEIAAPAPKAGEVLVRVSMTGASFGDVMLRRGDYPSPGPFPIIPGFEASGTVEAVGEAVPDSWLGRRVVVAAPNCNAEFVVCPLPFVAALPDTVSDEAATAAATNFATAYHLLHTVNDAAPGQTMLVYAAAGGVGSALIQLGKLAGLRIIGLTSSASKCNFVLSQGADHVINYKTADVIEEIQRLTNGDGVDLIMNSVAGSSLGRDFQIAAPLGRITLFGMAAGPPSPDMIRHLLESFPKSISLQLFSLATLAMKTPEAVTKSLNTLVALLADKKINPHIDRVLPMADAAKAHKYIQSGQVLGKILLKPQAEMRHQDQ